MNQIPTVARADFVEAVEGILANYSLPKSQYDGLLSVAQTGRIFSSTWIYTPRGGTKQHCLVGQFNLSEGRNVMDSLAYEYNKIGYDFADYVVRVAGTSSYCPSLIEVVD